MDYKSNKVEKWYFYDKGILQKDGKTNIYSILSFFFGGIMSDEMEMQINQGVTLVCKHDNNGYIVLHTKQVLLPEIIEQIKFFLIASGYHPDSVNRFIDD